MSESRIYTEAEIGIALDRCGKGQEGYPVWIRESHEELRRQLAAIQAENERLTDMHRKAVAAAAILLVEKDEYWEALDDLIASMGIELDDKRLHYLCAQVDRDSLERARQALAQRKEKP